MDAFETKVYTAILTAAIVQAILLVYFVIMLVRNYRKHTWLYKKGLFAEITALDNERRRMSNELHDGLGSLLTGVKAQIHGLETAETGRAEIAARCQALLGEAQEQVREISYNLMPKKLTDYGLCAAIRDFAEKVTAGTDTQICFMPMNEPFSFSPSTEVHIYWIFQELINNALKHSEATKIVFGIERFLNYIVLEIKDNGKGFSYPDIVKRGKGKGWENITNRVEVMNGDIFVDTSPGKGVSVTIQLPLTTS